MRMSEKPTKVERGGEVQPDNPDKGTDADKARHEAGLPEESVRPDKKPSKK